MASRKLRNLKESSFSREFFDLDDLTHAKPLSKLALPKHKQPRNLEESPINQVEETKLIKTKVLTTKPQNSKRWSGKERKGLLVGIKKYGFYQPEKIEEIIKTRTTDEIRKYIIGYRNKIMKNAENDEKIEPTAAQLLAENWNKLMKSRITVRAKKDDLSLVLSKIVEKMSHEKFPTVTGEGIPNFEKIYQYLSQMLLGQMPIDISPTDASLLRSLHQSLLSYQSENTNQEEIQVLQKRIQENRDLIKVSMHESEKAIAKTIRDERTEKEISLFDEVCAIKALIPQKLKWLNPLDIPVHLLKKDNFE